MLKPRIVAVHRCCACGEDFEQYEGETWRQAEDRHNVAAEKAHNARRAGYFEAHPGALDAILEDEEQGW